MLESYLCGLCGRGCVGAQKEVCLKSPNLNLGSGVMLKPECINFDFIEMESGGYKTDIIGTIENVTSIFKPETFGSIFSAHVIEHFYPDGAAKMIQDCYVILKPGGTLTIEGPDIEKVVKMYQPEKIGEIVQEIYGDPEHYRNYGEKWMHHWGWTGKRVAELMWHYGFTVTGVSDGISHHHPERDFRIKGVKP